ncbi:unnamed protein product, partial [Symbiodinium sp. KB8]
MTPAGHIFKLNQGPRGLMIEWCLLLQPTSKQAMRFLQATKPPYDVNAGLTDYGFVIYDHPPSDCLLLRIPIGNDPYVQSLGVEEAKAALQVRMSLLREHDIGILDPMDMTGNDYEYQRTIAE